MMLLLLQAATDAATAATTAAAAVATIPSSVPVVDTSINNTVEALAHQAGLVAITVWVLQVLKRSKLFPWINANTSTATSIVSTAAAFLGAVAIQFDISGSALAGWHGTFAIPSVHALWDGTIRFCGSKMGQEGLYRLLYKEPIEVTEVPPPPMDSGGKPIEKTGNTG